MPVCHHVCEITSLADPAQLRLSLLIDAHREHLGVLRVSVAETRGDEEL